MARRLSAVLMSVVLVATACGSSVDVTASAPVSTTTEALVPTTTGAPAAAAQPPTTTQASDPYETIVAHINDDVAVLEAFDEPDGEPADLEFAITNPTYFGNDLALMVTDHSEDGEWLRVQIPVRPNGTEAWIRSADAEQTSHRYRAQIRLGDRALTVWDGDDLVVETVAVIGKPATPTPLGSFFVNDFVEKWEGSAYGPHVLSLSAFSEAMETFAGGVPVIAIHGTNRPDLMGGAHSNGCIRIPNDIVTLLADTVPVGTPVDIVA